MSTFRVTFLGTGTSVGVPMIGCSCATCTSDDPRDQRARCSVLIETKEGGWLVDTGPDLRFQCLRAGITSLEAVFLTHSHYDHVAGFDELRRFTVGEGTELPIYARRSTLDAVETMFEYAFSGENRYLGYLKPARHEVDGPVILGDYQIDPIPVTHGKVETVGWRFSKNDRRLFGYVPDCKTMPEESREMLLGTDILVLDGLRWKSHPTHQSFDEAVALSRQLEARETWLTHFNCDVLHTEAERRAPKGVAPAFDGLQREIAL